MSDQNRLLSAALILFGAAFCLIYPLSIVWPSGWAWHEGSPASNDYFMMIVGVYATLGLFLIRAAKNPPANASLIWFTVWSSVVHALVMTAEALRSPMQHGHLVGDVPALLAAAIILGGLMSRTQARAPAGQ
jgi:FtsH-binding integral membrane protein